MDEVTMLQVLNEHGGEASSDFNDGDDVMGWFGWSIDDDHVLTVTFTPDDGAGDRATEPFVSTARWRLVPVTDPA